MGDIRIIKSVTLHPQQAEIEVEFFGDMEGDILKQCICCDQYHLIQLQVCPKTGKMIVEVARRQAEEENRLRDLAVKEVKAIEAKDKYLLENGFYGNCINWENSWRHFMALFGGIAVYIILAIIFHFVFGGLWGGSWIAIFVCVVWLIFWGWLDKRHRKSVRDKADAIYRRMLGGEGLPT